MTYHTVLSVMRSFSSLLLVLALLPISAALRCHVGAFYKMNEEVKTSISTVQECSTYCVWEKATFDTNIMGLEIYAEIWSCATGKKTPSNLILLDDIIKPSHPSAVRSCATDLCLADGSRRPPGLGGATAAANPMLTRDAGRCYRTSELVVDGVQLRAEDEGTIEECPSNICAWLVGDRTLPSGKGISYKKWGCAEQFIGVGSGTKNCQTVTAQLILGGVVRVPASYCRCDGLLCNGAPGYAPKPSLPRLTVTCYAGEERMIGGQHVIITPYQPMQCAHTHVCVWISGVSTNKAYWRVKEWKCAEMWTASGYGKKSCDMRARTYDDMDVEARVEYCRCDGDHCNGSEDAPKPGDDWAPASTTANQWTLQASPHLTRPVSSRSKQSQP